MNSGRDTMGEAGERGREERLLEFLKREGFQPVRVQLPVKPLSCKPPAYHPWGRQLWQFHIPTSVLPVRRNVLNERHPRMKGVAGTVLPTGSWGRRRRSGNRTSRRPRPLIDLGAVWL